MQTVEDISTTLNKYFSKVTKALNLKENNTEKQKLPSWLQNFAKKRHRSVTDSSTKSYFSKFFDGMADVSQNRKCTPIVIFEETCVLFLLN